LISLVLISTSAYIFADVDILKRFKLIKKSPQMFSVKMISPIKVFRKNLLQKEQYISFHCFSSKLPLLKGGVSAKPQPLNEAN